MRAVGKKITIVFNLTKKISGLHISVTFIWLERSEICFETGVNPIRQIQSFFRFFILGYAYSLSKKCTRPQEAILEKQF